MNSVQLYSTVYLFNIHIYVQEDMIMFMYILYSYRVMEQLYAYNLLKVTECVKFLVNHKDIYICVLL